MQSKHQRRWAVPEGTMGGLGADAAAVQDSGADQNMWLGFHSMWRHRQCPGLWERRGEGD